jgi:hypothetical protein
MCLVCVATFFQFSKMVQLADDVALLEFIDHPSIWSIPNELAIDCTTFGTIDQGWSFQPIVLPPSNDRCTIV